MVMIGHVTAVTALCHMATHCCCSTGRHIPQHTHYSWWLRKLLDKTLFVSAKNVAKCQSDVAFFGGSACGNTTGDGFDFGGFGSGNVSNGLMT